MKWKSGRRSRNVVDRRGASGGGGGGGLPLWALLPLLRTKGGWVIILGVGAAYYFMSGGGAPAGQGLGPGTETAPSTGAPTDEAADFVSVILASTEDVWASVFAEQGATYQAPRLVLFEDRVQSACGMNTSATGPFYCPPDRQVYLDLGFFRDLARMGGAGDFAAAYVIGHEVGHHIQTLTGTSDRVRQARSRGSQSEGNALSVLQELQADCYAGLWAHHANRVGPVTLEAGDVEEGLNAARAIGDDRLARQAGRAANPESFTHGSSEQRAHWLRRGLETGSLQACDTFSDPDASR